MLQHLEQNICLVFIQHVHEVRCYLTTGKLTDRVMFLIGVFTTEGLKTKSISWCQRNSTMTYPDGSVSRSLVSDKDNVDIKELTRRRRIGDKHTWMLELDTSGVRVPAMPTSVLESTAFRLIVPTPEDIDTSVCHYRIDYDDALMHPVLKYQYTTLAEVVVEDNIDHLDRRNSYCTRKCGELWHRLNELTLIELAKIPAGQWPQAYSDESMYIRGATSTRGTFDLPATWTFYDDEVIKFLDEAWKVQQRIDEREEAKRKNDFERSH